MRVNGDYIADLFLLKNTKTGDAVNVTQIPWINQAKRNTIVYFFITLNLLSSPTFNILKKRNDPNLNAQIYTNPAAIKDLK